MFNSDTGCWTDQYGYSLTSATFLWDSTAWANGSHTYQVTVTDTSNRTATSDTTTLSTYNYAPTVAWSTANNQTITGTYTISAKSAPQPFGTARIKKWCLLVDGSPVTTNVAYGSSIQSGGVVFNSNTGCWTDQYGYSLTTATFRLRTAAWTNGTRNAVITVTDTSNRTDTSAISFTTSNPQPSTSTSGLTNGQVVKEAVTFQYSIYHPGADSISSWCFSLNRAPCSQGTSQRNSSTSTSVGSVSFDTSFWVNGSYSLSVSAIDSESRSFSAGTINFTTSNPAGTATTPGFWHTTPSWDHKSTSLYVQTAFSHSTEATIQWGTNSKKLASKKSIAVTNGSKDLFISGLKPNMTYYFKVTAIGPNGATTTTTVRTKTKTIPPRPKPTPSYGGKSGSSFSYGWSIYSGWNVERYQEVFNYDPATFDCTGRGRSRLWSSNWWIVGIKNRVFAISKSPGYCR